MREIRQKSESDEVTLRFVEIKLNLLNESKKYSTEKKVQCTACELLI